MEKQEKIWNFAGKYGWLFTFGIALLRYLVELKKNNYQHNVLWLLYFWAEIIVVCGTLLIFGFVIYIIVAGSVKGIHNIKHCDIPTFEELDKFRKNYGNQGKAVRRTIEMINLYYKKNGKIDQEFVKPFDLQSLYIRYDFLEKDIEFGNDVKTVLLTLVMAIIYSILQTGFIYTQSNEQIIEVKGSLIMFIVPFLILLIFVFGRVYKGRFDSFFHYVSKYEMKELKKKIDKVETRMRIKEEQEPILRMQQFLMQYLSKYKDKTMKKKDEKKLVEKDIKMISDLDLCNHIPKKSVLKAADSQGKYKYYFSKEFLRNPKMKSDQNTFYQIYNKYIEKIKFED